MTSWIWMKGVEDAIADPPMTPVNENDKRTPVKDLIATHHDAIDRIKMALATESLYDPTKHDDLWCLRFVLSHKNKPKDAIKAAKHTLEFRAQYKLDEKDIRFDPVDKKNGDPAIQYYLNHCTDDALLLTLPDPKRGVVCFTNIAGIDQHGLMANLDKEMWPVPFRYVSEWQFQWLDYITRTTGLLTKAVRIIDLAQCSIKAINLNSFRRDAKAMASMEDTYPQLLHTIYVCHSPAFVQVPWSILRPLMPKRLLTKIDFINPDKSEKERKCLYDHLDQENLPQRFGGDYPTWPVAFGLPK